MDKVNYLHRMTSRDLLLIVLAFWATNSVCAQSWSLGAEYGYGGAWNFDKSNTRTIRPDDCLMAQGVAEFWPSDGEFGLRASLGWSETNSSFLTDENYAGIPTTLTYSSTSISSRILVLMKQNKITAWGFGIQPQWMYREEFGLYSKVDPNAVQIHAKNPEDWRRWNAGITALCRLRWARMGVTTFFVSYQTLPLYLNNALVWVEKGVNFRHVTAGASIGLDLIRR